MSHYDSLFVEVLKSRIHVYALLILCTERILDLERKAESLNSDKMKAERQNSDAQTKLEVLSNYFKQKELELQRWGKGTSQKSLFVISDVWMLKFWDNWVWQ